MAEHGEKNFEHELAKMFKKLDDEIKIPEIPDVQSIFEKAEVKEKKIIPFKKYSKYIAAAAAVVLVAISAPMIAAAVSGEINMDNASPEMADMPVAGVADEPAEAPPFMTEDRQSGEVVFNSTAEYDGVVEETESDSEMREEPAANGGKLKDEATNAPIKEVLYNYFSAASTNNPSTGGDGYDDVSVIEEQLNKKRSIDITIEESSVSVVLHDSSASEEIINAFWVEGNYESSYLDGNYYIINLSNYVSKEDIENNSYLPMAGDAGGVYTIPEKSVFIPEEITEGKISLAVEIDIGTGEYKIYASLV